MPNPSMRILITNKLKNMNAANWALHAMSTADTIGIPKNSFNNESINKILITL